MRSIQVFRRGGREGGERVRQGPGGRGASAHLTLVNNLADMIKWQVDGLQVVCLPVTQFLLGRALRSSLATSSFRCALDTFSRLLRKGPTINHDGVDALALWPLRSLRPQS